MKAKQIIYNILENISGISPENETDSLTEDLLLDSLNLVVLLLELEAAFDFHLEESDMNPLDLTTVQDVIHLVQKYREAAL